jgi:hypothetical protein
MIKIVGEKWMDLDEISMEYKWFSKYECGECKNLFTMMIPRYKKDIPFGCEDCNEKVKAKYEHNKNVIKKAKHKEMRLKRIWSSMKSRCLNKRSKSYRHYGARGISVCDEWLDFKLFESWALANGYASNLTIDRENNDGNYEPSNCRWTTQLVQSRNTRLLSSRNTSGYRGVSFHKATKSWLARISVDKIHVHIGNYDTAIKAAIARDKYVKDSKLEHTLNFE